MQTVTKATAPIPDWRYPRDEFMRGQVERDVEITKGIWTYSTYVVDHVDENKRYHLNTMLIAVRPVIVELALSH